MQLTFSSNIQAADQERRVIAGQIVPYNQVGNTSVGPVIFERGSIGITDTQKIKLLANHDNKNVIGRAMSFENTSTGIYGTFKISASDVGTRYLILASEDLVSGLSVGVDVIASAPDTKGNLVVTKALLTEVSLVEAPAFGMGSQVDKVAASQTNPTDKPIKGSEAVVTTAPETPQEESKDEEAPVVEASRPRITTPAYYTTPRHGITSMGRYTEHKIKAHLGNHESALWIAASEDQKNYSLTAAADSIGTTNPAFNPVRYMNEFISNTNFGRPAIDAIGRGVLPNSGMTFSIPKLSTAPTVAATAESGTPSNTGMVTAYITGTVAKYAGQNTVTVELLDRSSDNPLFFDELTTQMERAYLKATDAAVVAQLITDGTAATTQAATAAGLNGFISTESAACYGSTSYFAQNLIVGTGQWAAILGYQDSTNRNLYNAVSPMNALGNINNQSIKGNVLGANMFVDVNMLSSLLSDSMFLVAPETVSWYESPTTYFSVNNVTNMQVQMSIYGYGTMLTKQAAGIRRWVKT